MIRFHRLYFLSNLGAYRQSSQVKYSEPDKMGGETDDHAVTSDSPAKFHQRQGNCRDKTTRYRRG